MSDLAVNTSLLVATLDLNLVRSVIRAIRTADLTTAAKAGSGSAQAAACNSPKQAATQAVQRTIYIRNSEKPAATFEPRLPCPVHHWHTRLNDLQPYTCTRPVPATGCMSYIQPPWRVLPWPIATVSVAGSRTIKVQPNITDVDNVGRTLDLFV